MRPQKVQAVADAAEKRKITVLANKVASVPNDSQPGEVRLGREFVSLVFDSLGAPSTLKKQPSRL